MQLIYLTPLPVVYILGTSLFIILFKTAVALCWSGHAGLGFICLLLGIPLVFLGRKLGLINNKEGLRSRIRDTWTEVQHLVIQCNSLQGVMKRSEQIWGRVAPEDRPEECRCDAGGNMQAFRKLRKRLVSKAGFGFWLCRLYLDDYEHTTELLSVKTLFSVILYSCRECSNPCEGKCCLQQQFGDQFKTGVNGHGKRKAEAGDT